MKNILITGVSGYIAPYLCKALLLNGGFGVTGIYNSHKPNIPGVNLVKCDLRNNAELEKIFDEVRPESVYHLASVTPTRITTQKDDYISYFNGEVTGNIAKLCSQKDTLMIYTSTDLVYKAGYDLQEDTSPLEPLTIYAKTKLEGELAVKEFAKKYIILRTSLVYGFTLSSYTSFFDVAYKSLCEGKELRAFTDQFRNALYAEDAADVLVKLTALYKQNEVINFCGNEYLSRYDMCIGMCEAFGLDKKLVVPASCDEFTAYPTVKELGLSTKKLHSYGFDTISYIENLHKSLKFIP
ncbi:MAG TPA: sugar nucleotide-binding protein [Ignavibacteria bacterium]|nr:sugar nucleotide-binding protein [Ignavibacteria bacterium]